MSYFEEFYNMLVIDRKNSPYSKKHDLKTKFLQLKGEINELSQALENDDVENLKEELGDSLWDLFGIMIIAEEKGLFTPKEIISESVEKLNRRKPWIFQNHNYTIEEEDSMWQEAKKKEKENKKENKQKKEKEN
jgi:NTP pyrophosphatase (non-canonical NTP hydrolase)